MMHHKESEHTKDNFSSSMKQQRGRNTGTSRSLAQGCTVTTTQQSQVHAHAARMCAHTPRAHSPRAQQTQRMHHGRSVSEHQGGGTALPLALLGDLARGSRRGRTAAEARNPRTVPLTRSKQMLSVAPLSWASCPHCTWPSFRKPSREGCPADLQEPRHPLGTPAPALGLVIHSHT